MILARITNMVQKILSSGEYDGAILTQGSPRIEETMYWLNLALDVTVPICGNAMTGRRTSRIRSSTFFQGSGRMKAGEIARGPY